MNWYDELIEHAKVFISEGSSLMPVMFVIKIDRLGIIGLGNLMEEKEIAARIIRRILKIEDPDEYLLVMESWIHIANTKDKSEEAFAHLLTEGTIQVSELASKRECITVLHGTRKAERLGTIFIQRKGRAIKFKPIEWKDEGKLGGRFTGLR